MSRTWREESGGRRWSQESERTHLTVWECAGTFADFGPSWQAACELHQADGTALTWRSAPYPPTKDGLMAAMAWARDTQERMAAMLGGPQP